MHIFDNIFESILYMVFYDLTHDFYIQTLYPHLSLMLQSSHRVILLSSITVCLSIFPTSCVSYPILISTRWMVINELEEKILFILQSLSKLNLSWENSLNSNSSVTYQFYFMLWKHFIHNLFTYNLWFPSASIFLLLIDCLLHGWKS